MSKLTTLHANLALAEQRYTQTLKVLHDFDIIAQKRRYELTVAEKELGNYVSNTQ